MKKPNILSKLQKSTKITMVACAVLLTITMLVLMLLMLFPIKKEQQPILQINQPKQTIEVQEEETTATRPPLLPMQTEGPQTLSTWSASIEGITRSTDEYLSYIESTYEPLETMWHELPTDASEPEPTEPEWVEEMTETSTFSEPSTEYYPNTVETTTFPQTETETIPLPTEPPVTEPPFTMPPETEPPFTFPPMIDLPEESDQPAVG